MSLGSLFSGGVGGLLGAASVELVGDLKPLVASLEKGKAETAAASNSMGKSVSNFSNLATGAYVAAGVAVLKFVGDAIAAAQKHQVALTQLSIAAGANTQAFAELAAAQSNLTGFTEDGIIAAETQLSRLHLTAEQMKQLLPLTEDYARATGTDLPTAAGNLERAFLGNARALKAIGINFKATGDFAKDYMTITKALQQQVGGASAAYLKTSAGQIALLNAEYDKLKIQVGQGVQPALMSLLRVIQALLPVIRFLGYIVVATVGAYQMFIAVIQDTIAYLENYGHHLEDLIGIHHSADAATDHTRIAQDQLGKSLSDYAHQTDIAAQSTGDLGGAQLKAADSAKFLADEQKKAAAAAKAQKTAEDALKGGLLGIIASSQQVTADQQALNQLRKQGKEGTLAYAQAEVQALQDQLGLTQGVKDYLANLKLSGKTQQQVVNQVEALGKAFHLTAGAIDALLGIYLKAWAQINAHPLGAHVTPGGFLQGKLTGPVGSTSSGASTTNVTVHVHGSVTTQNDLVNAIHTSLLRKKTRNAGVLGL